MKVVILAGGFGTRLGEETEIRPKPMVEIGGKPILWHIMKIYSQYGFNDFVILTGYKQEYIKDYFVNYCTNNNDITVDLTDKSIISHHNNCEPWKVTILYTGLKTSTGSRIKQAQKYIGNERFLLTYGDGLSTVDIRHLIDFHTQSNALCTLTAVLPEGRYGVVEIDDNGIVSNFQEKPKLEDHWINSGYFVCEPQVFDYISETEDVIWEDNVLRKLAQEGKLNAYKHRGFWRPMDMMKDKKELNKIWETGNAPWKIWED